MVKNMVLRYLIRICIVSLTINLIAGLASYRLFRFFTDWSFLGPAIESYSMMASTVILPALVLIETIRNHEQRFRSGLLIDWFLVAVWFVLFWSVVFYGMTHSMMT